MSTKKPSSEDREEDSGLHDIRSLASSTKARLSSRRSTQNPAVSEDDILASSSAGWKAVALPEPAKMVSLPSLAELPSAVEIEKADKKATAAAAKAEAKRAKSESKQQPAVEAPVAAAAVADVAPAVTPIGSRIAAKQSGGKGKTIALVGTLVAAAAGVAIFMVVNNKKNDTSHSASATEVAKAETAMPALAPPPKAPEPTVEPLPPPPPEPVAAVEPAAAPVEEEKKPAAKADKKDKAHRVEIRDDRPPPKEAPKVEKKEETKAAPAKEGDPDFDQLLKEAGVSDQKKADKPKLEKKDLSGGDFKNGMNAVSGKARACYTGTQGTVKFKVNISPEGKVTSVKIGGEFAGKPEGSCVESAVKSASFPPWDGAPKSFDYSYLLSD
jgi:outer membrane biosynthesis protein TonB